MKANPTVLALAAAAVPRLAVAWVAMPAGSSRRTRTICALSAALFFVLSIPDSAESKQLCDNPDGTSSCCRAWGGTWVTGGSDGFCYRNLRIGNAAAEAACKAAGGKAETKDGEKVCSVPFAGGALAQ